MFRTWREAAAVIGLAIVLTAAAIAGPMWVAWKYVFAPTPEHAAFLPQIPQQEPR